MKNTRFSSVARRDILPSYPSNTACSSFPITRKTNREKLPFWSVLICLSGLLLGCYSPDSRIKYDSNTDFSRLKTYQWQPDAGSAFTIAINGKHYVDAMNAELNSKGFSRVMENADFSIHTHPVASHREGYESVSGNIDFPKAVIRVEFLNPRTGKPIWEGAVDVYISEGAATHESKKAINDAVETLLESFPPTGRK